MEITEIISSVRGVYPSVEMQSSNSKWRGSRFLIQRLLWSNRRTHWILVGQGETKEAAWINAWETITNEMLAKLEF